MSNTWRPTLLENCHPDQPVSRSYRGRLEFGARLRRLREDAGLTGTQLAEGAGWAQSKVSRIETGRQGVKTEDVRAWVDITGAASAVLADLLADLRTLRVHHASWRRQLQAGHAPKQRALIALEASATLDRTFQPDLVPGLLQTPDYSRHVLAALALLRETPNDVEPAVRLRMQRQAVLCDSDQAISICGNRSCAPCADRSAGRPARAVGQAARAHEPGYRRAGSDSADRTTTIRHAPRLLDRG